ncbi:MAG: hypothetical protein H6716_07195 [Polyangiaceae bacterium]|nr:hypothetical protein [Polyangiaceae bacterium]
MLPHDAAPERLVESMQLSHAGKVSGLERDGSGFALPDGLGKGDCVDYSIALDKLRGIGAPNRTRQYGEDWLLCADYWLWHAEQVTELPLSFSLPPGTTASFPWQQRDGHYLVPLDAHRWKSVGAVGSLQTQRLRAGEFDLEVASLGDEAPAPYLAWLTASAKAASIPFRGDPPLAALVVLAPEPSRGDSFGFAFHGGGRSSLIWAARSATEGSIGEDWAATHELFHLLMPYVRMEDAWFSEGVTTYYTAILRGRAGALNDKQVWWELVDGFERGSRVAGELPLQRESELMHEHRSYWRVYWSGAAIALSWELELAKAGKSLDEVMQALGRYGREKAELYTAEELIRRVEKELKVSLWSLAEPALASASFFDYQPLLDQLGVHGDSKHLSLRKSKLADLRERLTRGPDADKSQRAER